MGVGGGGPVPPVAEQLPDLGQVLARHDGLARRRVAQVVQAQPAEPGVVADRAPAHVETMGVLASGKLREQERVRVAGAGQRGDERPRGLAERHGARHGLRVFEGQGVAADIPPAQIEDFAAAASGERQQPDRGGGIGPAVLVGVECAPEPGQLAGVEEAGDLLPRVLRDAETGIAVALAQAPLLGPEQYRAQDLESAVGRAGPVPARAAEPRGHVLGADGVERHRAEGGQDAGLEVDAHGLAPGGLPVRLAAPQIFVGELLQRRGLLLPLDVVGGVPARADAGEHVAGAAAGLGERHLARAGDDDAAAPSLDAGLHDPDLTTRRVDAPPEAGQRLVEQDGVEYSQGTAPADSGTLYIPDMLSPAVGRSISPARRTPMPEGHCKLPLRLRATRRS